MGEAPLTGVTVLEVGNYLAAPFAGAQLADLGADVIKIESAAGDQVRHTGPFLEGESSAFIRLNRNKRSVVLDLKSEEGRDAFRALAVRSDVILENLRPGAMARLGLDYERLVVDNPGLVYVASSGWGQEGPLADLPGLDVMAQARSGLMSVTGASGGDPVKIGVPICDMVCALYGALAAVSALQERQRSGQGQYIDVSLFEAGTSFELWEAAAYFATGAVLRAEGSAHQSLAPYQAIRSADGWFTVGATTPPTWSAFCRALGLEDLVDDDRFADVSSRRANREVLIELIEDVTSAREQAHWLELLDEAGVPCAPIQSYDQVVADPQLAARDFFWDAPHPVLGSVRQIGSPMRFSRTPVRRDHSGPRLGEHTDEVLRQFGIEAGSDGPVDDHAEATADVAGS